jgi:ligand-binding sensor domain-containing protein
LDDKLWSQYRWTFLFTYDNNLSNFIAFTNPFSPQDRKYYNIAIDNYGTKWIYGTNGAEGIIYFNDKNTPEIVSDDLWGILSTSNNATMLTNDVNCLAIDNFTSQIWLGTPSGISIIRNPYATSSNSNIIISNLSFLRGQTVLDIIVDVVGNKWIATTSGVLSLTEKATIHWGSITMNNSPLTTNEVNALAMNPNNGLLYLGTKQGLYIVQTSILRPDDTYLLKTYPEPFNIDRDLELTIDGLVCR